MAEHPQPLPVESVEAEITRLLEDRVWCNCEAGDAFHSQKDDVSLYLRQEVFPTLVPAIHELVEMEQSALREVDGPRLDKVRHNVDPVSWLAMYLLRNNTVSDKSILHQHPYCVVNRASLEKQLNK